ncbi:hypothetical protein MKX01_011936, partial [Papaver californicum]
MITEAISSLKEKSGSSPRAISKFVEEKYYVGGLPQNFKRMLSTQLNKLTKSGNLVKVKKSFKLPETEKSKSEGEKIVGFRKYAEKYERSSRTVAKIRRLEDKYEKKKWERLQQQQSDQVQTRLYKQRSEIIESIPKFWPTAFMSDYALRRRLNEVDKKITKFLNSVVVEGCPYSTSECTITLGITAGLEEKWSEQSHTDMNKSFFTWFCEDSKKELHDQVANSIACDLWFYAPNYFVD